MAGRARRTGGFYKLAPPAVVGPITILPKPVQPKLAVQADRAVYSPQRRTQYLFRGPIVVLPVAGPPPGPAGREIIVELAGGKRRGRWRIRPPLVVDAAGATSPPVVSTLQVTLVTGRVATNVRHKVVYNLEPPQAILPANVQPTPDQLVIRMGPKVRIRPVPARYVPTNPAVLGSAVLDYKNQVKPRLNLTAVASRRTVPRTFYKRWPTPYYFLVGVQPATINFTSTVSGTVLRLANVAAATINFTSTVTAGLVAQRAVTGNITFTATMTGSISGGNQGTQIASFPVALLYILMGER